jgi:transcriptional regulator with XRE-family HTH domain
MEVGQEIRRLREANGWSQAKLAAAADMAVSGVSQIETGARNPSAVTLRKLADALNTEVAAFFPKDQAPLPFEEAEERQPVSQEFTELVESLDREQLVKLWEWQKQERIRLRVLWHDHPENLAIRGEFTRAVERLMYLTLTLEEDQQEQMEATPVRGARSGLTEA